MMVVVWIALAIVAIAILRLFLSRRPALRVLMYHKVSESHTDFLTVTTAQLASHLDYIRQRGYTCISLSDCLAHLEDGSGLPRNSVLLTFDDGYENNAIHAYPVLKQHEAKAAVFIVPSFVGKTLMYDGTQQSFMDAAKLKAMQPLLEYGWHSLKHDNYASLSAEAVQADIVACKSLMADSGIEILPALAYPYGAYPKQDKAAREALFATLEQCGIKAAFRIGNRLNSLPLKNRFLIQRIDVRGNESFEMFKRKFLLGKLF